MFAFICRRVLTMIFTMFFVSILLFILIHIAPGKPFAAFMIPSLAKNPEYINHLRNQFGLDQSIYSQYIHWFSEVVHGNLGYSQTNGLPVLLLIKQTTGKSLILALCAEAITLTVGIPLGFLAAIHKSVDYTATVISLVLFSVPPFFIGISLIYIFSITLQWLPSSGTLSVGSDGGILNFSQHLLLPAFTLALLQIASYSQFVRSTMLDTIQKEYVRTARAKGLAEWTVLLRHVFRNASQPIVSLFGLDIATFLAGAPLTEYMFTWPGLGQLAIEAVQNRDYPVIMAVIMLSTIAVLLGSLITDILYTFVEPRVRYARRSK